MKTTKANRPSITTGAPVVEFATWNGATLRSLRRRRGMTRAALVRALTRETGETRTYGSDTVKRWEGARGTSIADRRDEPGLSEVLALCRILRARVEQLVHVAPVCVIDFPAMAKIRTARGISTARVAEHLSRAWEKELAAIRPGRRSSRKRWNMTDRELGVMEQHRQRNPFFCAQGAAYASVVGAPKRLAWRPLAEAIAAARK